MSVFRNWIWPVSDDEKLARWQALYKFDYSSLNNWKKVKDDDEDEFITHFKKKWAGETISTDVSTKVKISTKEKLRINQLTWLGKDNKKYEKERKAILTKGFKAFQYKQIFG